MAYVEADDADMLAAISTARSKLPEFWAAFEQQAPGDSDFARVHRGMTRDDTRRALGTPVDVFRFRSGIEAWDYEYRDAWNYLSAFSVLFGPQGTVVATMSTRLKDGGDLGQ